MYVVLFLIIFSIFIRRFIPAKGFLLDPEIEALTYFGESRKIELRDLSNCNINDLVTISDKPVQIPTQQVVPVMPTAQPAPVQVSEGVDLKDIKGKAYAEVDTDYMYGNMDASNESLADTLRKGGL